MRALFAIVISHAAIYSSDPYATFLLDALVNYAVTGPAPEYEIQPFRKVGVASINPAL